MHVDAKSSFFADVSLKIFLPIFDMIRFAKLNNLWRTMEDCSTGSISEKEKR